MTTAGVSAPDPSVLDGLIDAADEAIARTGACRRSFHLAGRTVTLVGAGPALINRLTPAFEHLPTAADTPSPVDDTREVDDAAGTDGRVGIEEGALVDGRAGVAGHPHLEIRMWDSASTGIGLPELADYGPTVGNPVTPLVVGGGRSFVFHAFEGAVSHLDHPRGVGVYAVQDASVVPPWERACPLRTLLTWWLAPQDLLVVHGAAVGGPDGAVVLTGPGGSGKSTTALAALAAGMGYLGDDYVLVDPTAAMVWSLYGSAKLAPDHLARFPGLLGAEEPHPTDPTDAKRPGWPLRDHPDATVVDAPISAMVLPRVVGTGDSTLEPVGASRALLALAPPTMFQTPGDQRQIFALTTRLARSVPCYDLALGADPMAAPDLLADLLARPKSAGMAR